MSINVNPNYIFDETWDVQGIMHRGNPQVQLHQCLLACSIRLATEKNQPILQKNRQALLVRPKP